MAFRAVVKRLAKVLREAEAKRCALGLLAVGYYGLPRSTREIEVLIFPSWASIKKLLSGLQTRFRIGGQTGTRFERFSSGSERRIQNQISYGEIE